MLCFSTSEDSQWHPWSEISAPDSLLAVFWKDLRKFFTEKKGSLGIHPPSADWYAVPD